MPMYQVVEKDGVKSLAPINEATSSTAAEALNLATEAKATADNKVSKAGDVMNGNLTIAAEDPYYSLKSTVMDITQTPADNQYVRISGMDKNNKLVFQLGSSYAVDGSNNIFLNAYNSGSAGNDVVGSVGIIAKKDGSNWMFVPTPPVNSAGREAVNVAYLNAVTTKKLEANATIYVGGANASDTADLHTGRGFSPDKPFASLMAALNWARANCYAPDMVTFVLQSDQSLSGTIFPVALYRTVISSSSGKKITLTGHTWAAADLTFSGVKIDMGEYQFGISQGQRGFLTFQSGCEITSQHHGLITASPQGVIRIYGSLAISGVTGTVFIAQQGGIIDLVDATLSGTNTGSRYACRSGGRILTNGKGPDFIPGDQEGSVETASGSIYY